MTLARGTGSFAALRLDAQTHGFLHAMRHRPWFKTYGFTICRGVLVVRVRVKWWARPFNTWCERQVYRALERTDIVVVAS